MKASSKSEHARRDIILDLDTSRRNLGVLCPVKGKLVVMCGYGPGYFRLSFPGPIKSGMLHTQARFSTSKTGQILFCTAYSVFKHKRVRFERWDSLASTILFLKIKVAFIKRPVRSTLVRTHNAGCYSILLHVRGQQMFLLLKPWHMW